MEASPDRVKEGLARVSSALGFDFMGVARAEECACAGMFRQWLEKGFQADMEWLVRNPERRCDPRLVLPGACSVIVLGMNYYFSGKEESDGKGRFAKYACGEDYHGVIEEKLADIDELLQIYGGTQRYYVDTGPVLERAWAQVAGLGWCGKSGLFIHPEAGSWTFLSVILTTLDLPADSPSASRCGFCRRCMDSCPTGAITAPQEVDSRRCLSWLTIENKGPIPVEFRKSMGDRIYGCDVCTAVCPWNRKASRTRESRFLPHRGNVNLPLRDYLRWTEDDFRTHFRHSAVKRIKWRGFMRNVCIAVGNIGTQEDIPLLLPLCDHEDPLIAEHAQWAVEEIRSRIK